MPGPQCDAVNCIPTSTLATNTSRPLYEEVLGIITYPQVIYSRSGSSFTLNNPPDQPVTSEVSIPTCNLYVGYTWQLRPSLGTGDYTQSTSSTSVVDPFNLQRAYGPQYYDFRFLYNLSMLYQPPFFKGQHGVMGKLLGGWSFAPISTANSGAPRAVGNVSSFSASTYGEVPSNLGAFDEAELVTHYTQGNSAHLGVAGSNGIGTNNPTGINIFSDPAAAFAMFTSAVPGVYNNIAGAGILRGLPTWNLDATVSKDVLFTERIGATFVFQFTNVLNHVQYGNPSLALGSPTTFGRITSSTGLVRQLEMGIRVHF